MADQTSAQSGSEVEVWAVRPGLDSRGWVAKIDGPYAAQDREVVDVHVLYDVYRETSDGVPIEFGTWMAQQGASDVVREVRELREAYDDAGEMEQWTVRLERSNGGSPGREQWDTRDWTGSAISEDEAIGKALREHGLNGGWTVKRWWRNDA